MRSLVIAVACMMLLSCKDDLRTGKDDLKTLKDECVTETEIIESELATTESETYSSDACLDDFEDYQLIIGSEGKRDKAQGYKQEKQESSHDMFWMITHFTYCMMDLQCITIGMVKK